MTKDDQLVFQQACKSLGIKPDSIIDAKVYPDRVIIIDHAGRKLTVNRLELSPTQPPNWPDGFPPRLIKALDAAHVTPDSLPHMWDTDLLLLEGIGPASLETIRSYFPQEVTNKPEANSK